MFLHQPFSPQFPVPRAKTAMNNDLGRPRGHGTEQYGATGAQRRRSPAALRIRSICRTPFAPHPSAPRGTSGLNFSYSRNPTRFSSSGGNEAAKASISARTSSRRSPKARATYSRAAMADIGLPFSLALGLPSGAGSTGISEAELLACLASLLPHAHGALRLRASRQSFRCFAP
jgi:hypothetical protein